MSVFDRLTDYYERCFWGDEGLAARQYMLDRHFTEETLRKFRIGYAPAVWSFSGPPEDIQVLIKAQHLDSKGNTLRDRMAKRIVFPIADERGYVRGFCGRTIGTPARDVPKYWVSSETEYFRKGDYLYGMDLARESVFKENRSLLNEGFTDVMAWWQVGVRVAVSIMGVKLTAEQITTLAKYTSKATMCLDPDAAGTPATLKAAAKLQEHGLEVSKITLPAGKDPADFLLGS